MGSMISKIRRSRESKELKKQVKKYRLQLQQELSEMLEAEAARPKQVLMEDTPDMIMIKGALMNPVILTSIFINLDISELKVIRGVCKTWEAIATTCLGDKKAMLKVCTIVPSFAQRFFPTLFNNQIAKNIKMMDFDNDFWSNESTTEMFQSFEIFPTVDQVVENIYINTAVQLNSHIVKKMNEFAFPKLHSIAICNNDGFTDYRSVDKEALQLATFFACLDWRVRPALRFVEYLMYGVGSEQYHLPNLQSLVNSSPNLEGLILRGNLYPDLSRASNLKSFKHSSDENVDLQAIKVMLTAVQKTIVELELVYCDTTYTTSGDEFCLPSMSNLTKLAVDCRMYRIQTSLDEVNLPKLKHLSISGICEDYTVRDFLTTLYMRHNGIASLDTCPRSTHPSDQLIQRVTELFPNVEKLNEAKLTMRPHDMFVANFDGTKIILFTKTNKRTRVSAFS